MVIDTSLKPDDLRASLHRFWDISAQKLLAVSQSWDPGDGAPVFTVAGRYTTRGWTDWTQGFQHGSALLQYEATGDPAFLDMGRRATLEQMGDHITHFGVHDHGFNIVSTYGVLRRLVLEGLAPRDDLAACELALRCSGAVQARRWTALARHDDLPFECGFIHSFNGPHSLFVDTIRSLRSLALAHMLGQTLMIEQDRRISLLDRLCAHAAATARYSVYYGEGRDVYDVRGRVAHECLFNPLNGSYRCPSTQQGYSPFSTWTRGLAWAICGFAEVLEFFAVCPPDQPAGSVQALEPLAREAACATADYYIENTSADGIPYWDTGAPGLVHLGDWRSRAADPYNDWEPVDSSAAAIAAQGLLRLGLLFEQQGPMRDGSRYLQAGLTVAHTLLGPPYLSQQPEHQGLLLHSVYHRPNGWDYIPPGRKVPCGEATMWGDYHARELVLIIQRLAEQRSVPTFHAREAMAE